MTVPKKKPNKPATPRQEAKRTPSEHVKRNIRRQRTRPEAESPGATIGESGRRKELTDAYGRFTAGGIPVSAPELARLAIIWKKTQDLSSISNENLDDLVQFIARCQWCLEATRSFWGGYGAAFLKEDLDEPEPPEAIKRIRSEKWPISFERGLILIGIADRSPVKGTPSSEVRTQRFYPIFKSWYIGGHRLAYLSEKAQTGQVDAKDSWIEPRDHEIRAAFEQKQREGWTDSDTLEALARFVSSWKKRDRQEVNRTNARSSRSKKIA